jgi:hypothetical protein
MSRSTAIAGLLGLAQSVRDRGLLALGDLPLALLCIFGLPRALGRTHWQLLTNQAPA